MKTKMYQVRVSFKSTVPNVKIRPASLTGIVVATNGKKAEELAINKIRESGNNTEIIFSATNKAIPMSFYVDSRDEK